MKLLVVEDKKKTGEYLTKGLIEVGFVIDLTDNGLNDCRPAMTGDYDLTASNTMLLDVNGWDIVRISRFTNKGMPIPLLTALSIIKHRVKGLGLGADDYPMKLFVSVRLLVRMRTLLWRGAAIIIESQLQVADLMVDLVSRKVTRSGMRITLTNKEFILPEFFLRYQDEMLPRSLIASQAWGMSLDSDTNAIDVTVEQLHDKVDNDLEPKLVQAVRGVGYMLEVPGGQ